VRLKDGSEVAIRAIEPTDRDTLVAGFERMSPESRYRRFFGAITRLSERQLDYLTRVDHHDHEALLAVDEETGDGVGVARFVRTGEGVAEPAIAVIDDWQGRGVASVLLDALADRAREEGIHRFTAPVLADNAAAIRVFERLGATRAGGSGREVELLIELPERAGAPRALHEVLRGVAGRALQPTIAFWQRLATPRTDRAEPRANAIVLSVDAEDDGGAAASAAAALAAALGATVHLVATRLVLEEADTLTELLGRRCDELRRAGVEAHAHIRRGDLGAATIDVAVAERARLIVAEGGEPGEGGRMLGTVWDHVAHHAPCDVLIARSPHQATGSELSP
jgi:RimJ/RimL family protein N-acetyltransferase